MALLDIIKLVRTNSRMANSTMRDLPYPPGADQPSPRLVSTRGGSFPSTDLRLPTRRNPLSSMTTQTSPQMSLYTRLIRPTMAFPTVLLLAVWCFPPGCEIRRFQGFRHLLG